MIDISKIQKNDLLNCFKAIGKNESIMLQDTLLTDYEFIVVLKEYLQEYYIYLDIKIKVKEPYVIISDFNMAHSRAESFADVLGIPKEIITDIDYNIGYNYIINCEKLFDKVELEPSQNYSSKDFLHNIFVYGKTEDIEFDVDILIEMLRNRFEGYAEDRMIAIDFEDKVMAIGIDKYIPDAKIEFSSLFGVDESLFIEVSNPYSTVMLIDAEKYYLLMDKCGMEMETWLI